VFCSDVDRAASHVAQEAHVLLTSDQDIALRFATFAPVHSMYNAAEAGSMFPNFDALEAENTRVRSVQESEIVPHLQTSCGKKKLSSAVTQQLCQQVVSFRKFYIPRSVVRLANDTLQSQIFHCVEDLVMQHVDVRSSAPVIQRVIAIDNPSQVLFNSRVFCSVIRDNVLFLSVNVFVLHCSDLKREGFDLGHQVLLCLYAACFYFDRTWAHMHQMHRANARSMSCVLLYRIFLSIVTHALLLCFILHTTMQRR
jgi:hypothetical protein